MPLRDHFHSPLALRYRWDMLHGGWPMKMAERLNPLLPPEYQAGPNIPLGRMEVDLGILDERDPSAWGDSPGGGGTALYTSAEPTLTLEVEPLDVDEYEVKVYRDYDLVAAVELVSPSNKDRPETRDIFTSKCAALLKAGVCVTIIDVVTSYRANLFGGLLDELGWPEQTAEDGIYVATLRGRRVKGKRLVNTWYYPPSQSVNRCRPCPCGSTTPSPCRWNWRRPMKRRAAVSGSRDRTFHPACHFHRGIG